MPPLDEPSPEDPPRANNGHGEDEYPAGYERIGLVWLIAGSVLSLGLYWTYWHVRRAWELQRRVGPRRFLTAVVAVLVVVTVVEYAATLQAVLAPNPASHPSLLYGLVLGNLVALFVAALVIRRDLGEEGHRPAFWLTFLFGCLYLEWFLSRDPSARRTPAGVRVEWTAAALMIAAAAGQLGAEKWVDHRREVSHEATKAAHAALTAGRTVEADRYLAEALAAYPANDGALVLKAWTRRQDGKFEQA